VGALLGDKKMSVQAGIWNFDQSPIQFPLLENFSRLTAEYGPDGESKHVEKCVAMLFRSFHTTSESRREVQPYLSGAGRVFTWDGRLDNRDEFSRLLHVAPGPARTDIAIVAMAFDHMGTSCFPLLRGDWALAIWNSQEKELVLARDYIGVKPLFYYFNGRRILWCSHLAPLALCGDRFTLCEEYIAGYFAFHPDAHLTPYREILSVAPGSFVRIRSGRITKCCYWTPSASQATPHRSDREYEDRFLHLLQQAVRRRLRTDSPALAELSGGLDSSSIVCVADQLMASGGADISPRLDTFSYYDSNEPGEDDRFHFNKVEEKRRRTGFSVDLRGEGDSLPLEVSTFTAIPGFECRAEIQRAISEITQANDYRVMLCGLGGDEVNGQTFDPRVQLADLLAQTRGREFIQLLLAWSLCMRQPCIQVLLQTLVKFLPTWIEARMVQRGQLEPWIKRSFATKYRISARQLEAVENDGFGHPRERDTMQTICTLSRQLTRKPPSLLEQRYPFLDQDLVEFLTTIPVEQLLRPGQRRWLMKRALAQLLPSAIVTRTTKTSAGRCYTLSLSKHWNRIEELLEHPLATRLGYVERASLHRALLRMKAGQIPSNFLRLLKALALELWLQDVARRGLIVLDLPPVPEVGGSGIGSPTNVAEDFGRCC
jgi:asparagine synthase (glutamine-hydrolysing)